MADNVQLITPEATLLWAWLFNPRKPKNPAHDPKFMCDLVFSPAAMQTPLFAAMRDAATKAARDKFGDKVEALIKAEKFIVPFWKNERKVDDEGKLLPGYLPGGCYITIKSKHRPGVVKANPAGGTMPLIDENEIYPGCTVQAVVDCYAYDNESKGVSFGLTHVLKVRDGERLSAGGRPNVGDAFASVVGSGFANAPAENLFG